jgi:hypothetical protein
LPFIYENSKTVFHYIFSEIILETFFLPEIKKNLLLVLLGDGGQVGIDFGLGQDPEKQKRILRCEVCDGHIVEISKKSLLQNYTETTYGISLCRKRFLKPKLPDLTTHQSVLSSPNNSEVRLSPFFHPLNLPPTGPTFSWVFLLTSFSKLSLLPFASMSM